MVGEGPAYQSHPQRRPGLANTSEPYLEPPKTVPVAGSPWPAAPAPVQPVELAHGASKIASGQPLSTYPTPMTTASETLLASNIKCHPDEVPIKEHLDISKHSNICLDPGQRSSTGSPAAANRITSDLSTPKASPNDSSQLDARVTGTQVLLDPAKLKQLNELQKQHQQKLDHLKKEHQEQICHLQTQQHQQLRAIQDQQMREYVQMQQRLEKDERPNQSLNHQNNISGALTNGQGSMQNLGLGQGFIQGPNQEPGQGPNQDPQLRLTDPRTFPPSLSEVIARPVPPFMFTEYPQANSGEQQSGWEASWRNVRNIQLSALASAVSSPYIRYLRETPSNTVPNLMGPAPVVMPLSSKPPPEKEKGTEYKGVSQLGPAHSSPSTSSASGSPHHTRDRSYGCHLCPKAFTLKTHLDAHLRRHAGERPHLCNQCGKRFIEKGGLVKHERIHSGERPFKCSECNAAFAENSNLKRHLRTHTTQRPFRCQECPASYAQRIDLLNHQHIHSGEQKQFACEKCSASFERKAHLNRHFNMIHRGVNSEQKPLTLVRVHSESDPSPAYADTNSSGTV